MQRLIIGLVIVFGLAFVAFIINFVVTKSKGRNLPLAVEIMTVQTIINNLEQPLKEYSQNDPNNAYPSASAEEGGNGTSYLVQVLTEGNYFQFTDEMLSDDDPPQLIDVWGNPMRYQPWKGRKPTKNAHNVDSYDLWSAGPDGNFNTTADNITNWSANTSGTGNVTGVQTRRK